MPSWVSVHSEPNRKKQLVEKKLHALRAAVREERNLVHISSAAEKVRLAAVALIKAKRALLREYPQRDPRGQHWRKLQNEEQRWLALSIPTIVEEFGKDDA
jgi:hypothetical protein